MNRIKIFVLVAALSLGIVGCAPTITPIPIESDFWAGTTANIGVVMLPAPPVAASFPGADCLLCMMTAQAANGGLARHVATLNDDELKDFPQQIVAALRKKQIQAIAVEDVTPLKEMEKIQPTDENGADRDFGIYRDQGFTHVVLVDIGALGVARNYAAYVPTGDPFGVMSGSVALIDVANNKFEMRMVINSTYTTGGNWNDPPSYPSVTNSFYAAIEQGKEMVLSALNVELASE